MNPVAEEILMHYGMPRRSGRYPWGSGDNPYQHSGDFLSRIDELKSQGLRETEIAEQLGLTTTQLRTQMSLAKMNGALSRLQLLKDLEKRDTVLTKLPKRWDLLMILRYALFSMKIPKPA